MLKDTSLLQCQFGQLFRNDVQLHLSLSLQGVLLHKKSSNITFSDEIKMQV